MSRNARRLFFSALVVSAVLTGALPVVAAPISWSSVDVVLHADPQAPLLIVSGTVPEGATLPAEGVLAVPAGSELQWAGEVLGGPVNEDPEVQPQVTHSGNSDVYTFTVRQGPSAQLEALTPGALTASGPGQQVSVSWVAPQDVPTARIQVRIPVGSQLGQLPSDAKLEPGPTGYSYVTRNVQGVKAGDTLALQFSFVPGTASSAAGAANSAATRTGAASTLVPALLVLGTAVALVALFVAARKRIGERREPAAARAADAPRPPRASPPSGDTLEPQDASASEDPAEGAELEEEREGGRRWSPATLITVGVIVVLLTGAIVAVNASTKPKVAEGKITRQIAQVDQCTSATFALKLPKGISAETAADDLFAALETAGGVGLVTVYTDDPRIEVGFCESNTTEEAVRSALAPTGLLAQ